MRKWLVSIRGGRTQAAVAYDTGISQSMYSAIERGNRTPCIKTAKKLGELLGFDWTMFYEDEEAPDNQTA